MCVCVLGAATGAGFRKGACAVNIINYIGTSKQLVGRAKKLSYLYTRTAQWSIIIVQVQYEYCINTALIHRKANGPWEHSMGDGGYVFMGAVLLVLEIRTRAPVLLY